MSACSQNDYSLFQKYCEAAIGQLSQECIVNFQKLNDEASRIQLLYKPATEIPILTVYQNGKDIKISQQQKVKGNALFAKKDYLRAVAAYDTGIVFCPQDTAESRELLAILIANRSAAYFEEKEFKKVLNDIDYLTIIGNYPTHLNYKIWLRKAKCYDAFQKATLAEEAYDEALKSLVDSKLDEKTMKSKTEDIVKGRNMGMEGTIRLSFPELPQEPDFFEGGKEYIAAHPNIHFKFSHNLGRYAVASDPIEIGTTILEENAHSAVIEKCQALSNCQNCFVSVSQVVACSTCANVVFCSTICERLANKSFHKHECPILSALYSSGASVNCLLAMRIISQKHYSYYNDKKNKLKDYLVDNCEKNVIKKKTYRHDDYDNIFFLCRNENVRKKENLIHFTFMAVFLLRLLKLGKYFPFETVDKILKDEEVYFGCLLSRHLQLLQYNAHEVSELQNLKIQDLSLIAKYENARIGAAVYPTLALFNHSCDPNIVRYNIKSKVVVRTIKPMRAGDVIYENYGPLYMNMLRSQRQDFLRQYYCFDCLCTPCLESWPIFNEMEEDMISFNCKNENCPFFVVIGKDDDPFVVCDHCGTINNLLPCLKGLMTLNELLPKAEMHFMVGQLLEAMKFYIRALELLFKLTKPPHPEIIKIQQRVRTCMIHMGNQAFNYFIDLGDD